MKSPVVIINLKTYKSGENVLKLVKIIEKVDDLVILGIMASDLGFLKGKTKLRLFVQHVDPYFPGRNTGFILPESVKLQGAVGTFLNHSEHKLNLNTIKETISHCKEIGLLTAVFAGSLKEAKNIEKLNPDYLIYEPPLLVAGDISVSTAKPELISKISKSLKMPIIVGAGIKNNNDLKKSIELGAVGIAVASAITLAEDPQKVLKEMIGK